MINDSHSVNQAGQARHEMLSVYALHMRYVQYVPYITLINPWFSATSVFLHDREKSTLLMMKTNLVFHTISKKKSLQNHVLSILKLECPSCHSRGQMKTKPWLLGHLLSFLQAQPMARTKLVALLGVFVTDSKDVL
jgi:hypothetical protein